MRLGIHVREDSSVGWDVPFVIRARPAALDWPEIAWFAAMSETSVPAGWPTMSAAARPTGARGAAIAREPPPTLSQPPRQGRQTAGVSTTAAVASAGDIAPIREITSVEDFNAALAGGQLLVITDSAKPARLHPAPGNCPGETEDNFVGKVIERGARGGRYYTAISESAARERWPRMAICGAYG